MTDLNPDVSPMRLRAGDPGMEDVLALLHRSFAYMEERINPPSSLHKLTVEDIAGKCETGEVWTLGGPSVACIFLTDKPDSLYIGKLAVDPAYRGRGYARQLMDLAVERAVAKRLPALELETRIELTENHETFRRLGFEVVAEGAHEGFDAPTFVVMRKML